MNKVVRGLLWAAGLFVGCSVLLFVLLGGSMLYSPWSNERSATAFCAGLALGTDASTLRERAEAADARFVDNEATGIHAVRFSGWGYSDCQVTVVAGRVTARQVVSEAYD